MTSKQKPECHQKAYVCVHVFDRARSVLLVTRPDGDWCLLCGEEHADEASEYRVVGIGHVVDADATIREVLDLEPDWDRETSDARDFLRTGLVIQTWCGAMR